MTITDMPESDVELGAFIAGYFSLSECCDGQIKPGDNVRLWQGSVVHVDCIPFAS